MTACAICEQPVTESDKAMGNRIVVDPKFGGGEAHKICAANAQRMFA